MKTEDETRAAYEIFERYVAFIKDQPDVVFITATDAAKLYRDTAQGRSFAPAELKQIAAKVGSDVTFQRRGDHALAASEVFTLLNQHFLDLAAANRKRCAEWDPGRPTRATPERKEPVATDWSQLTRTAADVQDFLAKHVAFPRRSGSAAQVYRPRRTS